MPTRRDLMLGAASASACLFLPSSPVLNAAPIEMLRSQALDLIIATVRESLLIFADQSEHPLPGAWTSLAHQWLAETDLRAAVERELELLYKEGVFSGGGKLSLAMQIKVIGRFPIVPDLGTKGFFAAFALLARR